MRAKVFLAVMTSLLIAAVAGCGGGSSTGGGDKSAGMGSVTVTLSDPPTCASPAGPYSHVYVTVRQVMAHTSSTAPDSDGGWVDLAPNLQPTQIDLLGQANAECVLATLGATSLQAGRYQQIRLILLDNNSGNQVANNQCTGNDANCVVLAADSSVHELKLSSEANTGMKIPSGQIAGGGFVIEEGQTSDLNIDFDACASIVVTGNGLYRLKPVLHAGEVSLQPNLAGKVVDSVTQQPIANATIVAVLEKRDANNVSRVVMQKVVDANGSFSICPITAGETFDLVVAAIITSGPDAGKAYAATVVTGVTAGSALGNIPLVLPASALASTLSGKITTSTGSAAASADLSVGALQPIGGGVMVTVPLADQSTATLSLATAADPSCPVNTNCVSYSMVVPPANPNVGPVGGPFTQDTVNTVQYVVDALAFVVGSGGTANCTPPEVPSAPQTVTAGATTNVPDILFTGCTP